jgi:hypothetical protein
MLSIDELFKGRHFDREIIILCVRWYLRFKLSFRDLVEMMAERGIDLAHTTIMHFFSGSSRVSADFLARSHLTAIRRRTRGQGVPRRTWTRREDRAAIVEVPQ